MNLSSPGWATPTHEQLVFDAQTIFDCFINSRTMVHDWTICEAIAFLSSHYTTVDIESIAAAVREAHRRIRGEV